MLLKIITQKLQEFTCSS